jgi:hypothetical protein
MTEASRNPHQIHAELEGVDEYQAPPREHEQTLKTVSRPQVPVIASMCRCSKRNGDGTSQRCRRQSLIQAPARAGFLISRPRVRRARAREEEVVRGRGAPAREQRATRLVERLCRSLSVLSQPSEQRVEARGDEPPNMMLRHGGQVRG